jgi:hypothetical protein
MSNTTVRDNMILETRYEFGSAAQRNRGRYSGAKVHALYCQYVVGRVDPSLPTAPGTYEHAFAVTGKPVLYCCRPRCGCTSGQHAGRPIHGLTADRVTCTKCGSK